MPKYPLLTVYFHEGGSFHMQGKNFGNRVDVATGALLYLDTDTKMIHIEYAGKSTGLAYSSAKNWDYAETPEEVASYFTELKNQKPAKRVKTTGPSIPVRTAPVYVPEPFDPNDDAAAHRARVRAASANANKPDPALQQSDDLIQQSRMASMGLKQHTTAQVQNAQQVGQNATITGKKKAISHAQLKAQVAQEAKDPNA